METALAQLKTYASGADDVARLKLMFALHDLAYSLESEDDTLNRLGYLHLQTAATKIGFDLSLFTMLTESEGALTVDQVAQKTSADPLFLGRLMRYLASISCLNEVGRDEFTANNVTKNLTQKGTEAGISHCFETIGPEYQALPEFMKSTNYQNPTDELHTVCQVAWNTDKHQFEFFSDNPEKLRYFNDFMAFRRKPEVSWITVYPVREHTQGWDPKKPVYVNIGGGIGHQCAQFNAKYPDVPGRVILQDLPHSIEKAMQTPGVENMAHDFFKEQPVKGAKFYHTRGVLHNHPDHKVKLLLRNIIAAMSPESILLLDEMVLPDTKVSAYASGIDLTMMAAFAASERSESQWRKLLDEVGLKLVKAWGYNMLSCECVMDVRLK